MLDHPHATPSFFLGRVVDERGQPFFGATVELFSAEGARVHGWQRHPSNAAQTDRSGLFQFVEAAPFEGFVLVSAPGYEELRAPFTAAFDEQTYRLARAAK